ncbi:MAG TPA: AAA family ATPase [Candidatus Eremiobacteraceae bacterium]|nr:AAA family ATPase [Candidatus Eremiobacteraceae bacterium]
MRKWMRERLQRRKKKPAEPSDQPAPPPLQPAYFDAEQQPEVVSDAGNIESEVSLTPQKHEQEKEKDSEVRKGRSARPGPDEQTAEAQPAGPSPAAPSSAAPPSAPISSGQAGRSRRRRGGRGRGGRGREQAVAQAFTPAAVKGSITVVPAESAEAGGSEDNFSDAAEADGQVPAPVAATAPPKLPAAPAAAARAPKGIVVLAIGLPGSGKSTWFKRHNVVPLSSDMVRSLLFDDVREQRFQDLVFSNLRSMLKARLIAKRPMNYVDATNLTPQERQHWIKLAKDYQYEVHAVFFDVPLEVCLERHQRRDRVVPEDVMRRMAAKLKPPTFEEGIAKITVVRVKKKEPAV